MRRHNCCEYQKRRPKNLPLVPRLNAEKLLECAENPVVNTEPPGAEQINQINMIMYIVSGRNRKSSS